MPKYRRGDGRVMRRGRKWWLDFYVDGRRVRETAKDPATGRDARSEAEARSILRVLIGLREKGELPQQQPEPEPIVEEPPPPPPVTYDDLVVGLEADQKANDRKTAGLTMRRAELHLKPLFGGRPAEEINTSEVNAAVARWLDAGVARGEVNLRLATLRRAFRIALEAERIPRVPRIKLLTLRNARSGFLERPQLDRILVALPDYLRASTLFAYETGWRLRSEVLPLRWSQVDLDAGSVRLERHQTKGGEGRLLFATDELRALLQDRWEHRAEGCPYVFHRDGEAILRCDKAWKTAAKTAGLNGVLMHDMRRSAVRNYVKAGVPERVAMALCGHRTRSVFDRYHIVAEGDLREAAQRLNQFGRAPLCAEQKVADQAFAEPDGRANGHNLGHNQASDGDASPGAFVTH